MAILAIKIPVSSPTTWNILPVNQNLHIHLLLFYFFLFQLGAYVPYDGVADITKGQHTAREIFDAVYAENIKQEFYAHSKGNDLESVHEKIDLKELLVQPKNIFPEENNTKSSKIKKVFKKK